MRTLQPLTGCFHFARTVILDSLFESQLWNVDLVARHSNFCWGSNFCWRRGVALATVENNIVIASSPILLAIRTHPDELPVGITTTPSIMPKTLIS